MDAIKKGASDLHFEPYEHKYRIRFRIDGILHEVLDLHRLRKLLARRASTATVGARALRHSNGCPAR